MFITSSSLFITLVISSILILIFYLILTRKTCSKLFRIDFLSVLTLLILLRIFIPVEMPFTITIPLPALMNPIWELLNHEILYDMSIMNLIISVWILGIIINIFVYIRRLKKLHNLYNLILVHCERKKSF